ncbi:hypothetical protein Enr10x_54830 [Gimesia panareensis]|uniref:Uncharacterized protein n=2 Tax=Gimesia panareensis TaxID=2527978 RepID=A0A517QEQ1_9PLAN|nr:hypothetical protein Enr10x_54830 [Gimesia panareensis]QDU53212.1 hypothetical protein Pan110_55970 [Gimesia panareensis]
MTPVACPINQSVKRSVFFVLVMLIGVASLSSAAFAQKDPFGPDSEKTEMTPQEQEEAAQELLKGVEKLVLSQQKRIASKVIRLYPQSESAKIARLLLEEYKRFGQLTEDQEKIQAEWMNQVRNHWFVERNPVHNSCFFTILEGTQTPATKIVNRSKTPILYELKGPSMPWTGPYRLRAGESHEFHYTAQVRFFHDDVLVMKTLHHGQVLQLNNQDSLHVK